MFLFRSHRNPSVILEGDPEVLRSIMIVVVVEWEKKAATHLANNVKR